MIANTRSCFKIIAAAALCTALVFPAAAQQVVARVNGEPITAIDLAQRMKLLQVSSGGKAASRQQALEELIDQELKLQTARRYKMDVTDAEVSQQFAAVASRTGTDVSSFSRQLDGMGVGANAFKRKLRADIAWNAIVRGKFQSALQVRDRDVTDALRAQGKGDQGSNTYTLRPILFVVPRGAAPAAFEARKRDAEALRARVQSCDDAIRLGRGLRDTVVREQITRNSADVGSKQRDILDQTPVGRMTAPDITQNGVEVFAICSKVASKGSVAERDLRDQMMGERVSEQGKRYLRQLRKQSQVQIP